jgi:hypothetical protein
MYTRMMVLFVRNTETSLLPVVDVNNSRCQLPFTSLTWKDYRLFERTRCTSFRQRCCQIIVKYLSTDREMTDI